MQKYLYGGCSRCAAASQRAIVAAISPMLAAIAPLRLLAIVALASGVMTAAPSARAEMGVKQFLDLYPKKQYRIMNLYLGGLFEAVSWAESPYEDKPGKLFCPPIEISLQDMQDMVAAEIAARSDFYVQNPDSPMGQVALDAMRRRYPCEK